MNASDGSNAAGPSRSVWIVTLLTCVGLGAAATYFMRTDPPGTPEPGPAAHRPGHAPARARPDIPQDLLPDPDKPPGIRLDLNPPVLNFGTVAQGITKVLPVDFRSIGKGPLFVQSVKSTCGCYAAELAPPAKRSFAPDEAGVIEVKLISGFKEGVVRKDVLVYTNRLEGGPVRFTCVCDVRKGLLVAPGRVRFQPVPADTPSTATVMLKALKSEGDVPFAVQRVTAARKRAGEEADAYEFTTHILKDPAWHKVQVTITHPRGQGSGELQRWGRAPHHAPRTQNDHPALTRASGRSHPSPPHALGVGWRRPSSEAATARALPAWRSRIEVQAHRGAHPTAGWRAPADRRLRPDDSTGPGRDELVG